MRFAEPDGRKVQISDIHAGHGGMFRPDLMERVVEETNEQAPDLVAVAGDLTGAGYREQFEMAKGYSQTAASDRIRGEVGPSYNVVELGPEKVEVTLRDFFGTDERRPMAAFSRVPNGKSGFFLDYGRFVRYDRLPF